MYCQKNTYMSEKTLRRKNNPSSNRKLRPSSSSRRLKPVRQSSRGLNRSSSEPTLCFDGFLVSSCGDHDQQDVIVEEVLLDRPETCIDIFESKASLTPGKLEGYKKDAKVVVNVTVEGSPGPVRAMVKLGANVEETIKLVVSKYSEEGRTPLLDKDAVSNFQLHHNHFSLASLNKSDVIGDAGTRSFYLSRGNNSRSNNGRDIISASFTSDISLAIVNTSPVPDPSPDLFPSSLISRTVRKLTKRSCILWKLFGCLQCD